MTNAKIIINWCPHQRQPGLREPQSPGGCSPISHQYHYSLSQKTPAGIAKRTEKKHLKSVDALPHAGAIKNMMSISKLRSGIGSRTLGWSASYGADTLHRSMHTSCMHRCRPPACTDADPLLYCTVSTLSNNAVRGSLSIMLPENWVTTFSWYVPAGNAGITTISSEGLLVTISLTST